MIVYCCAYVAPFVLDGGRRGCVGLRNLKESKLAFVGLMSADRRGLSMSPPAESGT